MPVIVVRGGRNAAPLQEIPAAKVELSTVSARDAIEKNRVARIEVVLNHLRAIKRALPDAQKLADREWGRGHATLRVEALEEDKARLTQELAKLRAGH